MAPNLSAFTSSRPGGMKDVIFYYLEDTCCRSWFKIVLKPLYLSLFLKRAGSVRDSSARKRRAPCQWMDMVEVPLPACLRYLYSSPIAFWFLLAGSWFSGQEGSAGSSSLAGQATGCLACPQTPGLRAPLAEFGTVKHGFSLCFILSDITPEP